MQREKHEPDEKAQRRQASWRVHAAGAALACGAQVFLFGAGAAMPLCLNGAWLAALLSVPAAAVAAAVCRRMLAVRGQRMTYSVRARRIVLGTVFLLDAVFAAAALISLAEQSLLPQTRATHSMLMTAAALLLGVFAGGKGVSRLAFALRWSLPALLAALCALTLPLNVTTGLFPLLGTGLKEVLLAGACMPGAALPALTLLNLPQELERRDESGGSLPPARFFVWRMALGAGAGVLLLFALTLGSTYEQIGASRTLGLRLRIISDGQPREGLAQTGLTLVQMLAIVLLALEMLLAAQRMLASGMSRKGDGYAAAICAAGLCAGLAALLYVGFDAALTLVPVLAGAVLLALIVLCVSGGGAHG